MLVQHFIKVQKTREKSNPEGYYIKVVEVELMKTYNLPPKL